MSKIIEKPNVYDIVYNRTTKTEGKITHINYSSKVATLEVVVGFNQEKKERTTKLAKAKLFDLVVIKKFVAKTGFDKNRQHTLVKEFHDTFKHPVADKPTSIEAERGLARAIWTVEEVVEFLHASSEDEEHFQYLNEQLLKGLEKAYDKCLTKEFITDETERIVAQADALTDTAYFVNGSFVELGVLPQPLFEIVHKSNMSKLFTENGKKVPKYDEMGKTIKSPEFFPPEQKLKREIIRQSK